MIICLSKIYTINQNRQADMKKQLLSLIVLFLAALSLLAFPAAAAEKSVFVSIAPQKYFVEKIGGERVEVHIMVPPGASPHTYEPSAGQMKKLADADAYFSIGVTFEKAWLPKIRSVNPDMVLVDTSRGIEKRSSSHRRDHDDLQRIPGEKTGASFPEAFHDDPHIWLSPPLVMLQARAVLEGLTKIDPEGFAHYASHYASFLSEIVELDIELKERLAPGTTFMTYHPSWGYFADAYGLRQIPVEIGGKTPKARQIQEAIRHAREMNILAVMVQPQISTRDAETIAREINGRTVMADPLAEDWAQNLRRIADLIGKHTQQ